ncbi:MAG: hypothetical protein IE880_07135 [Epsilonproteobacteria bacterium]|nr:hypothetical protein [Campylobacterota bacterium]
MKQLITILLLTLALFAAEYKIGDTIDPINTKDQFEKDHNITKLPKTIVIAFEKESSYLFNDYMKNKNGDFLEQNNILFIADISQMPSFVTTSFALPKMRTYNYPVLLIKDENTAFKYPYKEEMLTILNTKNNTIQNINFASTLKELKELLE